MSHRLTSHLLAAFLVGPFLVLGPAVCRGEEFSFFGVRFGMTKAQIDGIWMPLGEDAYAVPGSPILAMTVAFDDENRLYEISFSMDLKSKNPLPIVSSAYQQIVNDKWGRDQNLSVTSSINRNDNRVTITSKRHREAYIKRIADKISVLFKP